MAIDAGTIQGFLDLDINGFVDKLDEASSTANQKLASIESQSESKTSSMSSKFTKLGGILTAGVTTPILGAGVAAVKTAAQWEAAGSKLQSTLGLTTEETERFTNTARNVYKEGFGESFDDIVSNLQIVGQSIRGLSDEDLQYVTTGVTNLADTMDMDVGESVRGVKALMQGFGLTAQEAMDLLAAGAQNGLNYTDELGDNLAEYGPRFSQMGFSASQYFQILQNGTESGAYNLDKCNDFLNEFQTTLIDGRMDESISSFSEGSQEMFNKWKSGEATMADVYTSIMQDFAGMEDGYDKAALASTLWSSLGEDNALSMINAMQPVGSTFDDVAGKSQEMADTASENLGTKWTSVVRTFQDGLGQLGSSGTGPLSSLLDMLQQLGNWFSSLSPEMQQVIAIVAMVVAAIGPLLIIIGQVIAAVSTIAPVIAGIAAVLTGPVGIVIAIAAVIAAIVAFIASNEEVRNKIAEIWNAICEFFSTIFEAIKLVFSLAWEAIKLVVETVINAIKTTIETVLNTIKLVIETIWNAIVAYYTTVFEIVKTIFTTAWDAIRNVVETVVNTIKTAIETVFNAISSFISMIWNGVSSATSSAWESIKSAVSNYINAVKSVISNIFNAIKSVISNAWNSAKSITSSAWDGMRNAVSNGVNGVLGFVRSVPSSISGALGNVGSLLWNAGSSIVNGLLNGIRNSIGRVYSFVSGIAGRIASLKGPESKDRKLLVPNGGWIISGLDEGLENNFEDTEDKVSGFAGRIKDAFSAVKAKTELALQASKEAITPTFNIEETMSSSGIIDYDLLGSKLAAVLKDAPIEPQVEVQMGEGDVYLDSERVGRNVAPVVSRVMTRKAVPSV